MWKCFCAQSFTLLYWSMGNLHDLLGGSHSLLRAMKLPFKSSTKSRSKAKLMANLSGLIRSKRSFIERACEVQRAVHLGVE
jgi:hypothetical protein